MTNMSKGNQPVLFVRGRTIPEAWQQAMIALYEQGCDVPTSFDRPGDPPSKDATVIVTVEEPLGEPRIHKRALPAGLEDLEVYRLEVVAGVHDHWVNRFGQEWNYTYHERIRAYDAGDGKKIDQWANMIDAMAKSAPDLTRRRFQIITWVPSVDPFIEDPPCLQRLHFRLLPDDSGGWVLNLNTDWRSRDGYKAWFMNVFAITDFQRLTALELQERLGQPVRIGRYVDKSDSLHIYGKDFEGLGGIVGFFDVLKTRRLAELTWNTEFAHPMFIEARHRLAAQLEGEKQGLGKGVVAPGVDLSAFPYPPEWDR
jgi:thymidylate synthase